MRVSAFHNTARITHIDLWHSIVEYASQEDAQRAVRELSEQPLLGRPVFIREVTVNLTNCWLVLTPVF